MENSEARYAPVFTEIHEMIEGIHKLSRIIRESAQISLVLAIGAAFAWMFLALVFLSLRGFDVTGIGIIPVLLIPPSVYLAVRVADHGIRTMRFADEWERRYTNLRELERKMLTDLGLPAQD